MLAIGRALMAQPRLLLLDEPSMGLAPQLVAEIFAAIVKLSREGMTMLLVEQNAHAALSVADFGYVIETGRTVMSARGPGLLADERVKQAYRGMCPPPQAGQAGTKGAARFAIHDLPIL